MAPRAVLFDIDGTLVDSGYIHAICWWETFRQYDRDAPIATIHRAVGMGTDQLVPHVLGEVDDDELAAMSASHAAIYSTYWSRLRLLPGARDLVRRCHDAGLVTVLASSASATEVAVLRRLLDVDDALDAVTTSDDADASKPEPDLVRTALDKAGIGPDDAVFLGDAVWDIHASSRAGVACVGVECGGTSAAELREAGAVAVYRDPVDPLEHWSSSVLA